MANVFFGGDAAFGPKNIITAVAHGHEAAVSIDRLLNGEDIHQRPDPLTNLMSQKMGIHEWSYDNDTSNDLRFKVPWAKAEMALASIKVEVELGFDVAKMYSAGNFIEATDETPYFQVGESKYGKPVLDRVLTPQTPLAEAAKCVLVSMDSTMKSNLSVGLPLDLVVYEADSFHSDKIVCIDADNPYYRMMHNNWGQKLREVFDSIEDPVWDDAHTDIPLKMPATRHEPLRKITTPQEKLI